MDWNKWHDKYEQQPALQARLNLVAERIAEGLLEKSVEAVVSSLCCGDARDLVLALGRTGWESAQLQGQLVELDPTLVASARQALAPFHALGHFQVQCADATRYETYRDFALADVFILSGVLGNVPTHCYGDLAQSLGQLCHTGALLIWTRSLDERNNGPEAVGTARQSFHDAGFEEIELSRTADGGFAVATARYTAPPRPRRDLGTMFEFQAFEGNAERKAQA
ncbi:hypothetical protein [Pseudomonas vanderleydeniana]|uniref:SAM-dependent methyltransferase n=1 Tax=Pseudomonas vanderleydeniana TaxID=2745495 RepID=A0A9E6PHB6_9PSED|nr:hypothetical protein [Pseudomonas vanderleydeniana]QXI26093.1 hypothetical protein HU752_019225 [Pseudomonas vanderleydeniana]